MANELAQAQGEAAPQRSGAWQPLTPAGVAAFALASWTRTVALLLLAGLGIGLVVMWLVQSVWFPVLDQAVTALPQQGEIKQGRLECRPNQLRPLAHNRFLSLTLNPNDQEMVASPSDVQVEFRSREVRVGGMLGFWSAPYPAQPRLPFNQREVQPWWGAWRQAVLAGVWVGAALWLVMIWSLMALVYVPLARVVAWLAGAPLSVGAAWRLCAAALMPGAVIMTLALAVYGYGLTNPLRLGLTAVFHILVGWVYVPLAVLCLPRGLRGAEKKGNPFAGKS